MGRVDMKISVVATPDPKAKDGVKFHLEDKNGCLLESVVFRKSDFPGMKKSDEHLVRFKLVQESGMTLEFAPGKNVALWVAQGDEKSIPPCPKSQPSAPNSIFFGDRSNGNSLTAVNTNPDHCYFSFALNFVDPKSATPTRLITFDPVGENKNGGIGDFQSEKAISNKFLLGAGVAALIGMVAFLVFSD